MAHQKFIFRMPAPPEVVFDAFHYHCWRRQWDSLVRKTKVIDGAECPYIGAITRNSGAGFLSALSMETRFVSFDRPRVAAATMIGISFPFSKWAASMRHDSIDGKNSLMIYTYTFEAGSKYTRWFLEPIVKVIFNYQTKRRFQRLTKFLEHRTHEIKAWQMNANPATEDNS